jgi:multidrug resistance protein
MTVTGDAVRQKHRGKILGALMATMALAAMDTTIVATVIPQVVHSLGGYTLFSWVFSGYLLAQTVTVPLYGKLADSYGRKPVLLFGIGLFLLSSALCAGSLTMVMLVVFRILQGVGAGGVQSMVATVAGDLYDVAERGRIQGWLSSVWGMSAVVGPTLGGAFATYLTWRWIFLVNIPIGAAAIALLVRYLREQVPRREHRIDFLGAAGFTIAAGSLFLWITQGGIAWNWTAPPSLALLAVGLAAAVATMFIERRASEPIIPPWLWSRRVLAGSAAATLGLGLLMIGPTTFLPTYAQSLLGLGPVAAGLLLATMSLTWPLASGLSARSYLRIGFRDTALIGAFLTVAGSAVLFVLPDPGSVWQCVLSMAVLGAGLGLLSTSLLVGMQAGVGWAERGVVTGANQFSRYLGSGLGASVYAAVANAATRGTTSGGAPPPQVLYLGVHEVFFTMLVIAALVVLVLLFVTPRNFPVVSESRR